MFRTLKVVLASAVLAFFNSGAQAAPDPVVLQLPAGVQTVHLGAVQTIPVQVTADSSFNGTVSLSLDPSELSQASAGRVSVSISPDQLQLSAGQTATATITVKSDTMAPTVASANVGLSASTSLGKRAQSQFQLGVDAVYEIHLFGGPEPEVWDSPRSVSFAPHPEGVTVRFINMDTRDSHIIHSEGPIPHGDTSNPLQPAAAQGQQGGIYEYTVTITDPEDDTYHCHTHESSVDDRTLRFNQQ
jgi:hypothetical protein